jgi:hypothetical protein
VTSEFSTGTSTVVTASVVGGEVSSVTTGSMLVSVVSTEVVSGAVLVVSGSVSAVVVGTVDAGRIDAPHPGLVGGVPGTEVVGAGAVVAAIVVGGSVVELVVAAVEVVAGRVVVEVVLVVDDEVDVVDVLVVDVVVVSGSVVVVVDVVVVLVVVVVVVDVVVVDSGSVVLVVVVDVDVVVVVSGGAASELHATDQLTEVSGDVRQSTSWVPLVATVSSSVPGTGPVTCWPPTCSRIVTPAVDDAAATTTRSPAYSDRVNEEPAYGTPRLAPLIASQPADTAGRAMHSTSQITDVAGTVLHSTRCDPSAGTISSTEPGTGPVRCWSPTSSCIVTDVAGVWEDTTIRSPASSEYVLPRPAIGKLNWSSN